MTDLQRAIEIAVEAHKGQVQKNGLPYVLHPLTLMQSVTDLDAKIAAVLHDVVEDTSWELEDLKNEGFSTAILDALDHLTHKETDDYESYIERIRTNEIARVVKLADLKDNMNIRRITTLKPKDLTRLARYHQAWQTLGGKDI